MAKDSGDEARRDFGVDGFDCDAFYGGLVDKVSRSDMRLWFGESTRIGRKGDDVYVEGPDRFYVSHLEEKYGSTISEILGDDVSYWVDSELEVDRQLPLDFKSCEPTGEDLEMMCSRYRLRGEPFYDEARVVLHSGNKEAYGRLNAFMGEEGSGPLVLHGRKNVGVTYSVKKLLHEAGGNGVVSIARDVGELVKHLTPSRSKGFGDMGNPGWYDLAKGHADLVVLENVDLLAGEFNGRAYHKPGTQRRIYELLNGVEKRGGKVVLTFTDKGKLDFDGFVDLLGSGIEDQNGKTGNNNLADLLRKSRVVEIRHARIEDYGDIIRQVDSEGDMKIAEGFSSGDVERAFDAANYGVPRNVERTVRNVEKVVKMSRMYGIGVSPEYVVNSVGGEKARNKFAVDNFERSDNVSSFLDLHSSGDIAKAFNLYRIGKNDKIDSKGIRVDPKYVEAIEGVWEDWVSQGDDVFRMESDDAMTRYRAMRGLMAEYKEHEKRLF